MHRRTHFPPTGDARAVQLLRQAVRRWVNELDTMASPDNAGLRSELSALLGQLEHAERELEEGPLRGLDLSDTEPS